MVDVSHQRLQKVTPFFLIKLFFISLYHGRKPLYINSFNKITLLVDRPIIVISR